jgi:endonuclease/exonuclease/phosphatase family metal-dependent hydrolase
MRKCIVLSFLLIITSAVFPQNIKVMTYNIRLDLKSDGMNSWSERKDLFNAQLQFYEPDIFGIQEALPDQVADISTALPAYTHIGLGRDGNNTGEASSIFFKTKRFEIKDSGTFWLSETPGIVSKGWDAAYKRVCTYILLKDKKSKKQFWVFNTHLDNEGETARTKGIELILSKMTELNTGNLPVIFTGDFNSEPSEPRIQSLKTKMTNTRDVSVQKPFGPSGTFNGFKHNEPVTMLIDYIFISKNSNWVVNKYAVLSDSKNLRYPSDHLPIFVQLNIKKK